MATLVTLAAGGTLMAYESPRYTVVEQHEGFEIRDYAPRVVAETRVEGDFGGASNEAFRRLAGYIFGGNGGSRRIAMTTPVTQERPPRDAGMRIAMTAPVDMDRRDGAWVMAFTMPAELTLASLPTPDDPRVALREEPARRVAALRFSGIGNESAFEERTQALRRAVAAAAIAIDGEPVFARYDPPWKPWFLRRNEVLLPVRPAAP